MLKLAYLLLVISISCVSLVFLTFFIEFKYIPWTTTKFGLICAFSYLGIKSFLWIKELKKEEK